MLPDNLKKFIDSGLSELPLEAFKSEPPEYLLCAFCGRHQREQDEILTCVVVTSGPRVKKGPVRVHPEYFICKECFTHTGPCIDSLERQLLPPFPRSAYMVGPQAKDLIGPYSGDDLETRVRYFKDYGKIVNNFPQVFSGNLLEGLFGQDHIYAEPDCYFTGERITEIGLLQAPVGGEVITLSGGHIAYCAKACREVFDDTLPLLINNFYESVVFDRCVRCSREYPVDASEYFFRIVEGTWNKHVCPSCLHSMVVWAVSEQTERKFPDVTKLFKMDSFNRFISLHCAHCSTPVTLDKTLIAPNVEKSPGTFVSSGVKCSDCSYKDLEIVLVSRALRVEDGRFRTIRIFLTPEGNFIGTITCSSAETQVFTYQDRTAFPDVFSVLLHCLTEATRS